MAPLKNIIFDLGGVLVDWNPRYLFRSVFKDPNAMEYFLSEVCNHSWNEKQDSGRSFAEGSAEVIAKYPQFKSAVDIYFKRWPETLGDPIAGTVQILESLVQSKKYKILALSNWSAETFPYAKQKFAFLKLFEAILVSGEEKLIKPDARFFNLLTERYQVVPQESLFIDDVEKNIKGAAVLGFQTIHFQNPDQLKMDLKIRFNYQD